MVARFQNSNAETHGLCSHGDKGSNGHAREGMVACLCSSGGLEQLADVVPAATCVFYVDLDVWLMLADGHNSVDRTSLGSSRLWFKRGTGGRDHQLLVCMRFSDLDSRPLMDQPVLE